MMPYDWTAALAAAAGRLAAARSENSVLPAQVLRRRNARFGFWQHGDAR